MMTVDALFAHYLKQSARMPRDPKFLEGMYCIRRIPGERHMAAGAIVKSSASRQQFQVKEFSNNFKTAWVAYSALLEGDLILFHADQDMWAVYNCLARQWQEDAKAEKALQEGAA